MKKEEGGENHTSAKKNILPPICDKALSFLRRKEKIPLLQFFIFTVRIYHNGSSVQVNFEKGLQANPRGGLR
jgi:hypothetical protein